MKNIEVIPVQIFRSSVCLLVLLALTIVSFAQSKDEKAKPATPQTAAPAQVPKNLPLSERKNVTLADLNIEITTDTRVIATMAALNAAGFDFEPGNRTLSPLRQQLRVHHDRNPDFQPQPRLAPLKHRRRYADNRVRVLINFDRLAHDLWIAAEMRLPQPVADHRDRSASRRVVL